MKHSQNFDLVCISKHVINLLVKCNLPVLDVHIRSSYSKAWYAYTVGHLNHDFPIFGRKLQ